jgi:hypothetical protein
VAGRQRMISEMGIGEEGFCSLKSLYGGPPLPIWGQDRRASRTLLMTRTFLLDSEIYSVRSIHATLHVTREPMGFAVRVPDGAPTVRFRRDHPPIPLPIVGINSSEPE